MMRGLVFLLLGMLAGCASEWHTSEPVRPTTYAAPIHRTATSVGGLSRLAVLPVDLRVETDTPPADQTEWEVERQRLAKELQNRVSAYLLMQKGYEARTVETTIADADAARHAAGRNLHVDGIVVVERWIKPPWSTAKAILNVFTLNIPLFRAMNTLNLRISIYETASGRLVWRNERKGEESDLHAPIELADVLGDLDNAIPALLRK
jgi:hypothetical protein